MNINLLSLVPHCGIGRSALLSLAVAGVLSIATILQGGAMVARVAHNPGLRDSGSIH